MVQKLCEIAENDHDLNVNFVCRKFSKAEVKSQISRQCCATKLGAVALLSRAQKQVQEVAGYECNLFDCLDSTVQVNHVLVDPHFKVVPRLKAFVAKCLATGCLESLGQQMHTCP